mmetsp:Transcript_14753/g.29090  ORF Transcript_14753/g.29090 Transcript_14753/m.29090 type:complete len:255 (+) Transcript_14753:134-898(+)|eukprot:CAMPEP_0172677420 /NCGR_PEP_ID=MMETSP1074-20121228/14661_1 /TAXON_ID=2916 /ORGANISM="Ceratium fusus, Strain PA161109" /LENGTH=254 /DNA_ID=CAMNT_0013495247 /DNA_START=35 /DNA_END=799 /DNA_ORIENTATION=+
MRTLTRRYGEYGGKAAARSNSRKRWKSPAAVPWRSPSRERTESTGSQPSTNSGASASSGSCNSTDPKIPCGASEVWLHVYDLGPLSGRLNDLVLRGANLGAFHCGVEVLGVEWSFQGFHGAWDDPTISGVIWNEPRLHPNFLYRESVALGYTPLNREAVSEVLDRLRREWSASSYHLVSHNCLAFAEEFVSALGASELLPAWVRGASDACRGPCVGAVASCGWHWFEWWSRRRTGHDDIVHARVVADAFAVRKV